MRADRYFAHFMFAGVCGVLSATAGAAAQKVEDPRESAECQEFRQTANWLLALGDTSLSADDRSELARESARAEALEIFGPPPDRDEPRFWIADGTFRQDYFEEARLEHTRRVDAYVHRMTDFDGMRAQPPGFTELVNAGATPEEAVGILIDLGPPPDSVLEHEAHQRWRRELRENAALFSGENFVGTIDLEEEMQSDALVEAIETIELPAGCRPWEAYSVELPPLINDLGSGVEN